MTVQSAPPVAPHHVGTRVQPVHVRFGGPPERQYYAYVPHGSDRRTPLVVVHGISRNAAELVMSFGPLADQLGVPLIAPLFVKNAYGMYQQLADIRSGVRSDLALLDILEDARLRWDLTVDGVALFGFSGGGQFVHRFALLHPERVSVCIPVSSGWYCWPDPGLGWPFGLRDAPGPIDAERVARVRMHVMVGARDRQDDEALRHGPEIDPLQGRDRVERARRWHAAMQASGMSSDCTLTLLKGARHSFLSAHRRGLVPLVFDRLLSSERRDR